MGSENFDVIVVGGGGSGLAAAIAAAEAGAQVILLEKSNILGGTTRLAIGSISATRTQLQKQAGIQDDPESHFEDIIKFAGPDLAPRDNIKLRRVLVENATETVAWLSGLVRRRVLHHRDIVAKLGRIGSAASVNCVLRCGRRP
jgi:succinate dehydrogenase/fumarate reductase flavoprotein subunit